MNYNFVMDIGMVLSNKNNYSSYTQGLLYLLFNLNKLKTSRDTQPNPHTEIG